MAKDDKKISFRLQPELYKVVERCAKEEYLSVNNYIKTLIVAEVKRRK